MSYSYYNGVFAPTEQIKIPLTDRALYFGDGIYDAAIGRGRKIFLLDEHIDRLYGNAPRLSIPLKYTKEELSDILRETVKRAGYEYSFVYFQLSRNGGKRIHNASPEFGANLLVTVSEASPPIKDLSIKLATFEDKRFEYCDIKTLNLLPSVLAATYAEQMGCEEAVFYRGDTVTECAHSNISILKNGALISHPENPHILPGITRRHLLSAARSLKIAVVERPFSLEELFSADEVIVTSTSKLIAKAHLIDNRSVGGRDSKNSELLCELLLSEYYEKTKP